MDPLDRPVFVLGERTAAMQLIRALETAPSLCAMPHNRLLRDLVVAVEHSYGDLQAVMRPGRGRLRLPGDWYRDVQAAHARQAGKARTVEFSGLAVARLHHVFPDAQFLVVHAFDSPIPRSRRLPLLPRGHILEMASSGATSAANMAEVFAFLGEPSGYASRADADLAEEAAR